MNYISSVVFVCWFCISSVQFWKFCWFAPNFWYALSVEKTRLFIDELKYLVFHLIFKAEHVWSKYVGNLSATVSSPRIFGKCSNPGFVFYTESFALLFCLTLPEKIGLSGPWNNYRKSVSPKGANKKYTRRSYSGGVWKYWW